MKRRPPASKWPTSPLREQAVDRLLAAAAGVALEGHLVADEDAPDLALRHLRALPRRRAGSRCPRGGLPAVPGAARRSSGRGDRRVGDLGRAVEVVDVVAEAVHPLDRQLARQRRARERGDPQRGEVVASRASPRAARGSAASSPAPRRARRRGAAATACSVSSGSKRRRSTIVEAGGRLSTKWVKPQEWKSGAAITIVSRRGRGSCRSARRARRARRGWSAGRPSACRWCPR